MPDEKQIPRFAIELTVLVCGAVVMIYEIIGSRIVSPFIGTSTYVWTSLIGVILGALSLGYWLGGRYADKNPNIKILASVIFLAGGLVSITIFFKDLLLAMIAAANAGLEIKSMLAAIFLFAPASVAFGFVTPYAVKLKMLSLEDSGKVVGRLYALSTVGSIAGTFAAGFILIPFVGSVRTLYLIAGTLFILSFLLAAVSITRAKIAFLTLFAFGIAASELMTLHLRQTNTLYDIDTEYSRVQLFQIDDVKTGKRMQAMATDPYFVQSAMFLESNDLAFEYNQYYHLIRYFKPDFQRTLMLGGAGYSFPKEYLRKYPNAEIEVVEIDPRMTKIAREFFRLKDDPRLKITHEDGRIFLNRADSGKFDAVLMDAFGSLFSVPYQLTTVEAVRQIDRVLKDDGIAIFNVGSALKGESSRFLQAEFATYRLVFPNVFVFKVNADYTDEQLQNLMVVACKTDCSPTAASADPEIARLLSHRYSGNFPLTLPPLTDDLAPVEYYNSFAQNLYRRHQ